MTGVQTCALPIFVLFGRDYWRGLTEWIDGSMLANGNISKGDNSTVTVTDDPDEAAEIATSNIIDR